MSLPLNQVITGDCAEVMREWPENSVDCIVTDPPYGLSFMGKDWDKTLPPRESFEEIIRVLKPGALAFVMSSPRQDVLWRMLSMLEGVGFELRQSFISWIYKTGFPKSYDVSKGIDRKFKEREEYYDLAKYLKEKRTEKGLTTIALGEHFKTSPERINHGGCVTNWEKGHNVPTPKQWEILTKILDLDDRFDWLIKQKTKRWTEAERETIGVKKNERNIPLPTLYDGKRIDLEITAPIQELSKKWEGWKSQTGLKPALEMILMVNKPRSEPTIVDNVLKHGVGAINVDACRIPFQNEGDSQLVESKHDSVVGLSTPRANTYNWRKFEGVRTNGFTPKGRFPANLLISNGALDTGEVTKSGGHTPKRGDTGGLYQGGFGVINREEQHFNDEGSPFRFFDLDAWSEHHGFLDVAKPSKAERDFGLHTQPLQVPKSKFNLNDGSKDMRFDGVIPTPRRNVHPTVKPVKLMAYLIELGCPPDGVVVDPFVGSGTTCIAAKRLRRKWIGIEINPEYAEIADARINIRGPLDQFMEAEK